MPEADKFHIAVDIREDKGDFFCVDIAIDAIERDGKCRPGGGMVVCNIAVEISVHQGIPEAFVSDLWRVGLKPDNQPIYGGSHRMPCTQMH